MYVTTVRAVRVRLIRAGGQDIVVQHTQPVRAREIQQLTCPRPPDLLLPHPHTSSDQICFSSVLTQISVDKLCGLWRCNNSTLFSVCLFCLGVVWTCLASYFSFSSRARAVVCVCTLRIITEIFIPQSGLHYPGLSASDWLAK